MFIFAEIYPELLIKVQGLLYNSWFSDESALMLNNVVNMNICRYLSDTNPYIISKSHTKTPYKLNVWALSGSLEARKEDKNIQENQLVFWHYHVGRPI